MVPSDIRPKGFCLKGGIKVIVLQLLLQRNKGTEVVYKKLQLNLHHSQAARQSTSSGTVHLIMPHICQSPWKTRAQWNPIAISFS